MTVSEDHILDLIRKAAKTSQVFTPGTIQQFLDMGRVISMPAKSRIMKGAMRVPNLLIPLSAPLYAYVDEKDKKPKEIFEIGQLIGLPYALTLSDFPYYVRTRVPTEILTVPCAHIRSMIDHDANLRWQIINFLSFSAQMRDHSQSIVDSDPSRRLADVFIEFAYNYGINDTNGLKINYKVSQDEIGRRIGTSRQTVNKYIQQLIEDELIAKFGHRYYVTDLEGLRRFSQWA